MDSYWNHNTAYHPWILRLARKRRGHVLDVGCGEGLLLQRLAAVSESVTGIDVDEPSLERAAARVASIPNASTEATSFEQYDARGRRFDLIVFVATIHHMDLAESLRRARSLLAPGGRIAIVGLSANESALDWILSGLLVPVVRVASWAHRETRDIGVPIAPSRESLREIRNVARRELPGASIRRGLYYRYLLTWESPAPRRIARGR